MPSGCWHTTSCEGRIYRYWGRFKGFSTPSAANGEPTHASSQGSCVTRKMSSRNLSFRCSGFSETVLGGRGLDSEHPTPPRAPLWLLIWGWGVGIGRGLRGRLGGSWALRRREDIHLLCGPGYTDSALALLEGVLVLPLWGYPDHRLALCVGRGLGDRSPPSSPLATPRSQAHLLAGVGYWERLITEEHRKPRVLNKLRRAYATRNA